MTGSAHTIRPVTRNDFEAWLPLWDAYLTFYESTVPEDVTRNTFERFHSGEPFDPKCLVAEKDGQLVGMVQYLYHRHNWRIENVCYLQDLYAIPEVRGQGYGRALIEAVYAEADAAGCPSVYWMTQHFNHEARKLYDRVAVLTPFIKYQRVQ